LVDKDLTLEVPAQDWPFLCQQNHKLYLQERNRAKDLAEKLCSKQKEYISREQEYRQVIEDIKRDIDRRSKKPLQQIKEPTDDEL
jgi:pantothenate synthetase